MKLLHYVEIENFKCFGEKQRIKLNDHTVITGHNNCGKTSALQAIALWSQAVHAWFNKHKNSAPTGKNVIALNRLNIILVPITHTRFLWHNASVRKDKKNIRIVITVGVEYHGQVHPLSMLFRNSPSDELVYCTPDESVRDTPGLIEYAANLKVELLHQISGLDPEEPILHPGRVNVLMGQGRTADVLRNLCLTLAESSTKDWNIVAELMHRMFNVHIENPDVHSRDGIITMKYHQPKVTEALDITLASSSMLQILLLFVYLCSHKRSILLVDEPESHLDPVQQLHVHTLLQSVANENCSQIIMAMNSEAIHAADATRVDLSVQQSETPTLQEMRVLLS